MKLNYKKKIDSDLLLSQLHSANLDVDYINTEKDEDITIFFITELTSEQIDKVDLIVEQHSIPVPSNIPEFVTRKQMKLAMLRSGISMAMVDKFIESLDEPQKSEIKIYWQDSQEFYRQHPFLIQVSPLMGITSDVLDNLFILAKTIN